MALCHGYGRTFDTIRIHLPINTHMSMGKYQTTISDSWSNDEPCNIAEADLLDPHCTFRNCSHHQYLICRDVHLLFIFFLCDTVPDFSWSIEYCHMHLV